jgi:hypothetical protein
MAIKKVIKNGIIKYVRVKDDNEKVNKMATLTEEDHRDKEIARLTALVEALTKEIEKQPKEAPSSDVMAVAAASTYDCYKYEGKKASRPLLDPLFRFDGCVNKVMVEVLTSHILQRLTQK